MIPKLSLILSSISLLYDQEMTTLSIIFLSSYMLFRLLSYILLLSLLRVVTMYGAFADLFAIFIHNYIRLTREEQWIFELVISKKSVIQFFWWKYKRLNFIFEYDVYFFARKLQQIAVKKLCIFLENLEYNRYWKTRQKFENCVFIYFYLLKLSWRWEAV